MTAVRKRRASGAPGTRFHATPVGGGEFLVEPSTPHVHATEGWVVYLSPNPVLLVVPPGGRWVAATSHTGAKVDLCREIAHGPDHVTFVDVELDVVWRWGEPARILDVEEFEALALPDSADFLAEADRIRGCVDAGGAPFGPAFRQRLLDLVPPGDALLRSTWASGVGPFLAEEVAAMVGGRWLDRQRAGEGWLLCGGRADPEVSAVAWVGGDGVDMLLAATATAESRAMAAYLMDVAPTLRSFPAPALPPATARW